MCKSSLWFALDEDVSQTLLFFYGEIHFLYSQNTSLLAVFICAYYLILISDAACWRRSDKAAHILWKLQITFS